MAGSWNEEEKRIIFEAFMVMVTIQKSYGRQIAVKATLRAWEYLLADTYSGEQIVAALNVYMRQKSDVPTPADLIQILSPPKLPKSKISGAEFLHAKEQWKLENHAAFSYYGNIVKEYEKQENEERHPVQPIAPEILKITHDSIKKITHQKEHNDE